MCNPKSDMRLFVVHVRLFSLAKRDLNSGQPRHVIDSPVDTPEQEALESKVEIRLRNGNASNSIVF